MNILDTDFSLRWPKLVTKSLRGNILVQEHPVPSNDPFFELKGGPSRGLRSVVADNEYWETEITD